MAVAEKFPEWSLGQVWDQWMKVVCPLSLVREDTRMLLARETELREYGLPPYAGAMNDQPQQLLDAFAAIREGRAQAEQDALDRRKQEMEAVARKR